MCPTVCNVRSEFASQFLLMYASYIDRTRDVIVFREGIQLREQQVLLSF